MALIPRPYPRFAPYTQWLNLPADSLSMGATSDALALSGGKGIVINGLLPADKIILTEPGGIGATQPGGWSPWGVPALSGPSTGSQCQCRIIPDENTALAFTIGSSLYNGYEAARLAFGTVVLTGYSSYRFFIRDDPIIDNSGGMAMFARVVPAGSS